jgi:lipopolysaccharide assembly outer membrane protein LptD (OstA)
MKKGRCICLAALLMICITSTTFAAVNNKYFRADKQYFDVESGQYFISGHIVINLDNGYIAGEKAQVKLSTLEFWGTEGWLLKQYDVTFKGNSAYVVFGKDIAMIEGGANLQRSNLQITSNKVDYNWKTKVAEFKENVQVIKDGAPPVASDNVKYNVETNEFVN